MSHDDLAFDQRHIRGCDSNSLLRMYDRAKEIFTKSPLQLERARANTAIERIAKELAKRKVPL